MRRGLILVVCGFAVVGCTLLVDLDGLAGGDEAGDAASFSDVVVDSSGAADAKTETFCSGSTHAWCEDFDEVIRPSAPFDDFEDSNQVLSLDPTSVSRPQSLAASLPEGLLVASATKKLRGGNLYRIAFDLRVDQAIRSGKAVPLKIVLPGDTSLREHSFYIETYGGPLRFFEQKAGIDGGNSYNGGDIEQTPRTGVFMRVEITLDRATSRVQVDIDGKNVADASLLVGFPLGEVSVMVGSFSNQKMTGTATFRFDNFTADID